MPTRKETELTAEEHFARYGEAANKQELEKRLPQTAQAFTLVKPPKIKLGLGGRNKQRRRRAAR